eukprot:96915_1
MSTKKSKVKLPSSDEILLDLWCIINGWDDLIVQGLKENGITTLTALKAEKLSTLTGYMEWDQCSKPKCICDAPLTPTVASECYADTADAGVLCDGCGGSVSPNNTVYHCTNNNTPKHSEGYDVCSKCTVINTKEQFTKRVKALRTAKPVEIKYPNSGSSYYSSYSSSARVTKGKKKKGMAMKKCKRSAAPRSRARAMPQRKMAKKKCASRSKKKNNTIGFSVGGAKDVNSFRDNILKQKRVPQINAISFEGIYYDYYFDVEETDSKMEVDDDDDDDGDVDMDVDDDDDKKEEDLPLFYPSYEYSKSCIPDALLMVQSKNVTKRTNDMIDDDGEEDVFDFHLADMTPHGPTSEYFLSVGLNSSINEEDFKRKHLNLVCVLDVSGSMDSSFSGGGQTKMKIANQCLLSILTHLTHKDRFGLVLFDTSAWAQIKFKSMRRHKLNQLESILQIYANGGTNFEVGWNEAIKMFDTAFKTNESVSDTLQDYENRIIFLTDACPNVGKTDPHSLMGMVQKAATRKDHKKRIYATFVGVGLDFNANLVSEITTVRGANYFAVHSETEFYEKLSLEFDYFVSPMVFNLKLSLQCEGADICIEAVYGSNDIDTKNGQVMNVKSLFPSPPDDEGAVKGGIVLIKLKNDKEMQSNLFIECSFEDKAGKKFKNKQNVVLISKDEEDEFYATLGTRKGILLTRYVILMKQWIKTIGERASINATSLEWKQILKRFKTYFENEMKICNDKTLKQEIKILSKIINSK